MQDITKIRNIVTLGHSKAGKTSVAEALLFTAGKTKRLGKVDEGTSVLDFDPEEAQRKLSINTSFHNYPWKKHLVFLMDAPADDNFVNEAKFAARVADCALFPIGATSGVKFQTEKFADFMQDNSLPTIFVINKMDKERANFEAALNSIRENLTDKATPIQLPIGAELHFKGIIDLIAYKAYNFDGATGKVKEMAIPDDMKDEAAMSREALMEKVAETNDDLIEKFLEEGQLSQTDLVEGITRAAKAGALYPVCALAATGNAGTELLLDAINDLMPSPAEKAPQQGTIPGSGAAAERAPSLDAPFSALVCKTMADPYAGRLTIFRVFSGTLTPDTFYNSSKEVSERFSQLLLLEGKEQKQVDSVGPGMIAAVAKLKETVTGNTLCAEKNPIVYTMPEPVKATSVYAISTVKKDDEDKLYSSVNRMMEEDPTLRLQRDTETNQTLISGVGQIHLQVISDKIKRKFGVQMELKRPKVAYKETIKGKARVQGKHKKQSGGRGQFADTWIEMEALPRGSGFVFEDKIFGGVVPRQYIPAVEKGIIEAAANGAIAGYPFVDFKVALVDGSYHAVDSSEMAFKIAGSLGFKKAVLEANPVLIEPIMALTIEIPKDNVGDVIGDLNSRRGKVMGMDSKAKTEVIMAQVPMSEILEYAAELTSITGGRGTFSVTPDHYEELPSHLADKIIAAAKEEAEK